MAGIAVVDNSELLKTTLGSCIGVVLQDTRKKISGLVHIMLPECLRQDDEVGKYADTAIPALLSWLLQMGGNRRDICAFVTGGANMFRYSDDSKIATIGEKNSEATKRILAELQIPITYEDTGGEQGRTMLFDNQTGEIHVRTLSRIGLKGAAK